MTVTGAAGHDGKGPAMTEFVCRRTGQAYEVGEQLDQDGEALVHAVVSGGPDLALKQYLPATLQRRPDLEARIKAMIANPPAYRPDRVRPGDLRVARGRRLRLRAVRGLRHAARRHARSGHDPRCRDPARHHLAATGSRWRRTWPGPSRCSTIATSSSATSGSGTCWPGATAASPCSAATGCRWWTPSREDGSRASPGGTRARRPSCSCPPRCRARSGRAAATSSASPCICTCCCSGARTPSEGDGEGAGTAHRNTCSLRKGCGRMQAIAGWTPYPGAAPLTVLPETLQQYFRAAFVDGARNPEARPPAQDWLDELVRLRESLVTCALEPTHSIAVICRAARGVRAVTVGPGSTPLGYIPRQASAARPAAAVAVAANAAAPPPAHHDPLVARGPAPYHRRGRTGSRRQAPDAWSPLLLADRAARSAWQRGRPPPSSPSAASSR